MWLIDSRSSNATISSSRASSFKYFNDSIKLFLQSVIAICCRLVVSTMSEPGVFFEINFSLIIFFRLATPSPNKAETGIMSVSFFGGGIRSILLKTKTVFFVCAFSVTPPSLVTKFIRISAFFI